MSQYQVDVVRSEVHRQPIMRGFLTSWWGVGAWCLLLVSLAYGDALSLPFFFDDFVHLPYVDEYGLLEMLGTAGSLAYYRPLSFVIWKLMSFVTGNHSPLLQHGFNLLLHLGNGLLVAWLAGHLWRATEGTNERRWLRPYLSATLYLLFPFSYQAVPWIGSMSHLLVTFLILASLSSYLYGQARESRRWIAFSLLATALAPFAHENGALIGPLIGLLVVTRPEKRQWRRGVAQAIVWSLPALLWLPIWWLAPKALSGNVALNGAEALLQNSVYFLQGLAYPLTWLGGYLSNRFGWNDLLIAAGLAVVALGAALAIQQREAAGHRRRWLPWLWYGLALVPAVLFLRFDYVINGPRLLTLASVGAAWLWADVFYHLAQTRQASTRIVGAMALLLLLAQNVSFVRARMAEHQMLGGVVQEATVATVAANVAGQEAVFVNFPSWLAPAASTYALGHEGPLFWPDYARPEMLVSTQTGEPARLRFARYDAIRTETAYHVGIAGSGPEWESIAANRSRVFVARYGEQEITLRPAGAFPPDLLSPSPLVTFAGESGTVQLLAATVDQEGERLRVRLTWRVNSPPAPEVTAFVHLLDSEAGLVAQADGDPLAGSYPFFVWPAGQVVEDVRYLPADGSHVRIGLYHRASGERLPAQLPAGAGTLAENAFSLPVQ